MGHLRVDRDRDRDRQLGLRWRKKPGAVDVGDEGEGRRRGERSECVGV